MRLLVSLLAALTLLATACGTTTSATDRTLAAGRAGESGSRSLDDAALETLRDASRADVAGRSEERNAASPGIAANDAPPGRRAAAGRLSPGVTATTVRVGALYVENQAAANSAIGAGGAGGSDARQAYDAVIGEINRAGGLSGRRIVPVYHGIDATSSTPVDQQYEQACSRFTQDTSVFAILGGRSEILQSCAKRHGALNLYSGAVSSVPKTFRTYPDYVEISGLNLVRMGPATVDGLRRQGYFTKGSRIGVVAWDYPNFREAVERGLRPAVRAVGFDFATRPAYIAPPQTLEGVGPMSAGLSNAVLRFSSERIDHVLLLDGPAGLCGVGCITSFFMRAAQSQRYYPRYGLNDNNAPVTLYKAGLIPADQLRGALAVGWTDYDRSFDVGWRVNATRERCYALMRKKGVSTNDPNSQLSALSACDEIWFLTAAINRPGGSLSVGGVMSWTNRVGHGFGSTQTYETYFSAAQHDGVAAVRHYRFEDGCSCFRYTSKPYRLPKR